MAESDMQELQEALSQIESIALSLGNRHQGLANKVHAQSQQAIDNIRNDRKALELQLQRTGRSVAKTIETSNTMSSPRPLLSYFFGYVPSTGDAVVKKDTLVAACTNLINNFEELTRLAGQANKRLNTIHRAAIQGEDEITLLAQDLEEFQFDSHFDDLEELQEDLEDARSDLQELKKTQAIAQEGLKEFRRQELACDIERRHQKKKARWLWAAAPVTGGLSAFPAMYASHSKRKSARSRDKYEDQANSLASHIKEAQSEESELSSCVQQFEAASSKLDTINDSTAGVVKQNQILLNMVAAKCEEYICLKEVSMTMVARARKLQGRVEMLEYTDGQDEVRNIMENLIEDLEDTEMGRLAGSAWYTNGGQVAEW
ncbi:MAG: hypothetical protein Q9225_007522 [Loekoesia sp. 1 TL-2023]